MPRLDWVASWEKAGPVRLCVLVQIVSLSLHKADLRATVETCGVEKAPSNYVTGIEMSTISDQMIQSIAVQCTKYGIF